MWIESHTNLARHPKTRRLMKLLGWSLPDTIGNLHLLWWWALDFAPTGDLTPFAPDQLTADLDLGNTTPSEFIEAMIQAGFLDRSESQTPESRHGGRVIRIHDWLDYTARSVRPRRKATRSSPEADVPSANQAPTPSCAMRVDRLEGRTLLRPTSDLNTRVCIHGFSRHQPCDANPPNAIEEQESASNLAPPTEHPDTERRPANIHTHLASSQFNGIGTASSSNNADAPPIQFPKSLSEQPGLTDIWWPKFLEMYNLKGCPITEVEQRKLLERLERLNGNRGISAVQMLKKAVTDYETSISAPPEFSAIPIPPRRQRETHYANST